MNKIDHTGIPADLKQRRIWVGWQYYHLPTGRWTKVPRSLRDTGRHASTDDPTTWVTYDQAVEMLTLTPKSYDGLGVVLADGLTGVDADACRDPETGVLADWAMAIVDKLDSYTEVSPSGTGIHVLCWAEIDNLKAELGLDASVKMSSKLMVGGPDILGKKPAIEVYDKTSPKYFCITGHVLPGHPLIQQRQKQFNIFYRQVFSVKVDEAREDHAYLHRARASYVTANPMAIHASDEQVLGLAFAASNGEDLRAHYQGHWEEIDHSGSRWSRDHSTADYSLVVRLAFYTGPDSEEQLERLFEASGMFRPAKIKKSRHYLRRTVERGLRQAIRTGQFFNWDWEKSQNQTEEQNRQLVELFAALGKITVYDVPHSEESADVIVDALEEGGDAIEVPLHRPEGIDLPLYHDDPTFGYLWRGNHSLLKENDRTRRIASVQKVLEMLPATGFLPHYIKTYLPVSDLPPVFHLASALSTASHFVNRKVGFLSGVKIVYPNLWMALVAQSTVIRKSTAIDIPYNLIVEDDSYCNTVTSDDWTKPQLAIEFGKLLERSTSGKKEEHETLEMFKLRCEESRRHLRQKIDSQPQTGDFEEHGVRMCHMHEVGGFLVGMRNKQNEGVKEMLTKFYDVPAYYDYNTKTSGHTFAVRPHPTLLGATTMEWLTSNITRDDIASGFMPRWILVPSWIEERDFKLSIQDEPDPDNVAHLKDQLEHLKKCHGLLRFTEESRRFFWDWDQRLEKTIPKHLLSWAGRMQVSVFKFAMLYEATVAFPDRTQLDTLSLDGIRFGTALAEYFLQRLDRLSPEFTFGDEERELNRVEKLIRDHAEKGVVYSDLLKLFGRNTNKLKTVIETLKESRRVVDAQIKTSGRPRQQLWAMEFAPQIILDSIGGGS